MRDKLMKTKNKETLESMQRKGYITYTGTKVQVTIDSPETLEGRIQGNDIFKVSNEKIVNLEFYRKQK